MVRRGDTGGAGVDNFLGNLLGGLFWEPLAYGLVGVVLLASLPLGYWAILRHPEGQGSTDVQLGLKVVLHYAFSLSLLMALTGAAMVVGDWLQPEGQWWSETQRTGVALVLVGGGFAGIYWSVLRFGTNDPLLPLAGRFFTGWRLALHCLVLLVSSAWLLVLLLQVPPRDYAQRVALSTRQHYLYGVVLVWGLSWLLHLLWTWWLVVSSRNRAELTWEVKD
jgi:hypothetical protein